MNENKNGIDREYEELVKLVQKELPGIVLPSMGMLEEVGSVIIDGSNYIIKDDIKEES